MFNESKFVQRQQVQNLLKTDQYSKFSQRKFSFGCIRHKDLLAARFDIAQEASNHIESMT